MDTGRPHSVSTIASVFAGSVGAETWPPSSFLYLAGRTVTVRPSSRERTQSVPSRASRQSSGVNSMNVIFSRKGFHGSNGGVASPIFPDGRICSIPVPIHDPRGWNVRLREIRFGQINLGGIVTDLTRNRSKRYTGNGPGHLDPDLRKEALVRRPGWLPMYGPGGRPQAHLARNGVGVGDIFLFFGWFRRVTEVGNHWRFVRGNRIFTGCGDGFRSRRFIMKFRIGPRSHYGLITIPTFTRMRSGVPRRTSLTARCMWPRSASNCRA